MLVGDDILDCSEVVIISEVPLVPVVPVVLRGIIVVTVVAEVVFASDVIWLWSIVSVSVSTRVTTRGDASVVLSTAVVLLLAVAINAVGGGLLLQETGKYNGKLDDGNQ